MSTAFKCNLLWFQLKITGFAPFSQSWPAVLVHCIQCSNYLDGANTKQCRVFQHGYSIELGEISMVTVANCQ